MAREVFQRAVLDFDGLSVELEFQLRVAVRARFTTPSICRSATTTPAAGSPCPTGSRPSSVDFRIRRRYLRFL